MKKLSSKDYYIEKELSEKHSFECRTQMRIRDQIITNL